MTLGSLLVASLLIPLATATYIDSVIAMVDSTPKKHEKVVPMVAFECGYRNKYIDENGKWVNDEDRYATCQTGKLDILKYCKKSYPNINVTNMVEYSHEVTITEWCREEGSPCKWTHTVRPYQCIDEFRAEALQVPHDCRFSHVNSHESCNDYQHWSEEAKRQCTAKRFDNVSMSLRSFAVLEPCGLDLFTGVEFVCCPSTVKDKDLTDKRKKLLKKIEEEATEADDDDDDSSYEEDDDSEETEKKIVKEEAKELPTDKKPDAEKDPYFSLTDPTVEHEQFKEAEERLDKKHRDKIAVVMNEWKELEARYQKMKVKDSKQADKFKASMTNRFQKTVASLEDEHKDLKDQLESVHEERVQNTLNEKKRKATHEYREALAKHVPSNNKNNVLKTLKTYIRSEEKDRVHMLNRYRHLLRKDASKATAFKPILLHRLRYIDLRINGTLAMLRDFPDLESQVKPIALAFWRDFRRENTPELSDSAIDSLDSLDGDSKNKRLVDLYREAYEKLHPTTKLDVKAPAADSKVPTSPSMINAEHAIKELQVNDSEEDDDEYYEDEEDEETKKTPIAPKLKVKVVDITAKKVLEALGTVAKARQAEKDSDSDSESDEDTAEENTQELRVNIEPIIEEKPVLYRHDKLVQTEGEERVIIHKGYPFSTMTVFILFVVFVLGVVTMVKRRRNTHRFIEVDVYSPEECHVSKMQVNGYENPTYSFFDSKA